MEDSTFDDLLAKFEHAQEHREDFDKTFDLWLDRQPIGLQPVTDEATGALSLLLRLREPPPRRLALTFADYVHNLRAVLDHAVWGLVLRNHEVPTKATSFPVVRVQKDWPKAVNRCLKGFPPELLDVVCEAQPYHAASPADHWLHVLHELDIESKHRAVVRMGITDIEWAAEFRLNRLAEEHDAVEHSSVPLGTPLEDGTVLLRARAISERGDLRVDRVVGISDAGISVGPVSAVNRGSGALPDFAALTQTVLDRLAPGFAT